MNVAVLGANWPLCAGAINQAVVPATGLPSPSVQVNAAPPHSWTSIPRCRLYQACSAGASLALKKMPPMPVTRFMEPPKSGGGEAAVTQPRTRYGTLGPSILVPPCSSVTRVALPASIVKVNRSSGSNATPSLAVPERERGIGRPRRAVRRLPETERLEELGVEIARVGLARRLFDHHAEQDVPRVVVPVRGAGREVERVGRDELDDRVGRQLVVPRLSPSRRRRVAVDARGVIQQLTDRHLPALERKLRHVLREVVIQLHAPLLDELHDRRGRELLRDGSDLVDRGGGRRAPGLHVGETVCAIRQRIAPANHRERRARRVRFGEIREDERVGARTECVARDGRPLGGGRREGGERREAGEAERTQHGMATSAHTASPPPPSRIPAGSRASSRYASITPRTTSAHGPPAWGAPRTRTHRSIPAPPTPAGASRLPRTVPFPTPA